MLTHYISIFKILLAEDTNTFTSHNTMYIKHNITPSKASIYDRNHLQYIHIAYILACLICFDYLKILQKLAINGHVTN